MLVTACKSQEKSASSTVLDHTAYQVITLSDNTSISQPRPTIQFDLNKGKISGFTGCNSYSTPVEINEQKIKIGVARVTKRYCQKSMKTERDFLGSLRKLKTYQIQENIIYFYNSEGNLIVKAIKSTGDE